MAEFIYDFPGIESYIRPQIRVPVIHEDKLPCYVDVPETGYVEMDIPEHLARKIWTGAAVVVPWNQIVRAQTANDEKRDRVVISFEIIET